jgi:hypothetical protein
MRTVYPVKYYRDEGFIETKFEVYDDDLPAIFEVYLREHADIDFDEVEVTNNRPMNVWLYVTCRAYVDPDDPDPKSLDLSVADVIVLGPYDGNPTGE